MSRRQIWLQFNVKLLPRAEAIHLRHFPSFLLLLPPASGPLNHFSAVNTSPSYSGFSEFIFPLHLPASLRNLKPRQFEIYRRADFGCFAELNSARHSSPEFHSTVDDPEMETPPPSNLIIYTGHPSSTPARFCVGEEKRACARHSFEFLH